MVTFSRIFSLKGIFSVLFAAMAFGFASCEKDSVEEPVKVNQMELFYNESKGLADTSIDSVGSFSNKFCVYMNQHHEAINDKYYTPTVDNMVSAAAAFGYKLTISTGVGITFDTEWDEGYFVTF